MADTLKLRAEDAEDLAVVSAVLQDALVPVADMAFLEDERRFVLVANRFRWERAANGMRPSLERTLAGVCFEGVTAVQKRGFSLAERDRLLGLLAVRAAEGGILVEFADNVSIRLQAERIACRIEDIGEPWPTQWRPSHPVNEP
jgi:Protein of unknown function (DUF2948)